MTLEANCPVSSIAVSAYCGIVVRKDALLATRIPVKDVLHALEAAVPLDEDGALISFGLDYFTDYCTISADIPEWCALRASTVQ